MARKKEALPDHFVSRITRSGGYHAKEGEGILAAVWPFSDV